jgi:hypothetical protein
MLCHPVVALALTSPAYTVLPRPCFTAPLPRRCLFCRTRTSPRLIVDCPDPSTRHPSMLYLNLTRVGLLLDFWIENGLLLVETRKFFLAFVYGYGYGL